MRVLRESTSRSRSLLLIVGALIVGFGTGAFLLSSVLGGEAAPRQDLAENSDFFKRGRTGFALCVGDFSNSPATGSELSSGLTRAVDDNKSGLWKGSFLEVEDVKVKSPCPAGPTVDESTKDVLQYLGDIRIVDKPGPYIVYVHIVNASLLATLDRLNLGRVLPQEYIDPSPNQPAGYQQVASGVYLSRDEFEKPEFLARQIAEALGCTEACAATETQPASDVGAQP